MPSQDENKPEPLVELIELGLRAYADGGIEAVQKIIDAHPQHSTELRSSIQALAQIGFLDGSEQLPQSFGLYSIKRRIGRGGMSEVFLAFDPRMKREVALKCAHPGLALEPRAAQRFQREIEAIAKLSHPGIVPVFDVGEAHGRAFFTMEYVEGKTLSEVIKRLQENESAQTNLIREQVISQAIEADLGDSTGPLFERTYTEIVCRWMLTLTNALEHAHTAGVIHRDVTPANIIVRQSGHAQLFDFGLARLQNAPALTMQGDFTGTPYYVSPEQLAGKVSDMDARCDIYSIGVTLYELLTLKRPFEGATTAEVLSRIQSDDPVSPRAHNPKIPRDLELICLTALDRDLGRRYATMAALSADLRAFLALEPVSARPLSPAERTWRFVKRRPAFASTLALSAILFIGLPPVLLTLNATIRRERDAAIASAEQARLSSEQATKSAKLAQRVASKFEEFMLGLFETERLGSEGMPVEELVSRSVERLAPAFPVDELNATGEAVELAMLEATGRVFFKMGLFDKAQKSLGAAIARRHQQTDRDANKLVAATVHRAQALLELQEFELAHSELLKTQSSLQPRDTPAASVVNLHLMMAVMDGHLGNLDEAAEHLDQALKIPVDVDSLPAPHAANLTKNKAEIAQLVKRMELACDLFRDYVNVYVGTWSADPELIVKARRKLQTALLESDAHPAAQLQTALIHQAQERGRAWRASLAVPQPAAQIPKLTTQKARAIRTTSITTAVHNQQQSGPLLIHFQRPGFGRALALPGWTTISIDLQVYLDGGLPIWSASQARFDQELTTTGQTVMEQLTELDRESFRTRASNRRPIFILAEAGTGPFATYLAFQHPGLFKGLVLASSFPGPIKRSPAMQNAAVSGLGISVIAGESDQVAAWFQAHTFSTTSHTTSRSQALQQLAARAELIANGKSSADSETNR